MQVARPTALPCLNKDSTGRQARQTAGESFWWMLAYKNRILKGTITA